MRQKITAPFNIFARFPQGIGTLFFVQIFSTLSYSVLYSTLVLYMTHRLGFSKLEANTITGFFIAFNYGLHFLGGFFGGRLISNRFLFSLGMIMLIFACSILSIPSKTMLYLGLAIFLTGSGLNVTCLNCMVTQLFEPSDTRRETAFFWIYSGMNVGFFTGFSISGMFEHTGNYHLLFMLSGLGNLMALFLVIFNWHLVKDKGTQLSTLVKEAKRKRQFIGVTLVLSMIPTLLFLLSYAEFANRIILTLGISMIGILLVLAIQQPYKQQTQKMLAFVMLMIASLVFWSLYQIAPMGLTLFIKHNVDTHLFGIALSPQWIQNVNTVVIVLGGPIISMIYSRLRAKGVDINIPLQFACALFFIGIAFLILPMGIAGADKTGLSNVNWILACYFLQSLGELLLSPVGYAMIGQLAPANLQGMMMGAWMMMTGVAATASNHFSNMMIGTTVTNDPLVTNAGFSNVFSLLGWIAVAAGVALLLLTPLLKRLMSDKEKEGESETNDEALEVVLS